MISTLFVAAFGFVMVGLGWFIIEKLDRSAILSSLERVAISFIIGCYILYLGVFFTIPYRLDALSVWSLLAICALGAIFGWKKIPWHRYYNKIKLELSELTAEPITALLLAVMTGIALSSLLQALAPPNDYDGLAYHLAFPRLDVESGRAVLNLKTGWSAAFFPALGGHLTRVTLVVADGEAAQMVHALFGIVGSIAAAALVLRLGYGKNVALAAAILFLSTRLVIWQMGSVETDVPVAALAMLSLLIYLNTRNNSSVGLEIIFGLIVASTILMKYHGLVTTSALVPLILYDLLTGRKPFKLFIIGPIVALTAITPHLVRDFLLVGNPIYPLLNEFFNPEMPNMLTTFSASFGTGRGLMDFLVAPWNISILPTHYFDGMVMGAPYFLALSPLIFLDKKSFRKWGAPLSYGLVYFTFWFFFLAQQVRFLAPIMPLLSAMAAAGVAHYWIRIRSTTWIKCVFVSLLAVLSINQSMFIGIFAILRLPVALGMVSPEFYHNNTPTMNGAYYSTCKYVENNIQPGERYFLIGPFVSYYCPQASASLNYFQNEEGWWIKSKSPPQMSQKEFLRRLNAAKFRYFLIQEKTESRGRIASKSVVLKIDRSGVRYGNYMENAFINLTPLKTDAYSAVYDGKQVLDFLNQQAGHN
jgi:hypothetical protein